MIYIKKKVFIMLGLWLRNQIVIAREFGYNIKKKTLQIWLAVAHGAIVDMDALIGKNVQIGHYSIISEDVHIGRDTILGDFVKLMPGTRIGARCRLDDYVNTSGYCEIGSDVIIKRCSMIGQATRIHNNARVMSHVTTIRTRDFTDENEEWIEIMHGALIGSHSCLLAGIKIGEFAVVGGGAVVTKDCEPRGIYVGNPAKLLRMRTDDEIHNQEIF